MNGEERPDSTDSRLFRKGVRLLLGFGAIAFLFLSVVLSLLPDHVNVYAHVDPDIYLGVVVFIYLLGFFLLVFSIFTLRPRWPSPDLI